MPDRNVAAQHPCMSCTCYAACRFGCELEVQTAPVTLDPRLAHDYRASTEPPLSPEEVAAAGLDRVLEGASHVASICSTDCYMFGDHTFEGRECRKACRMRARSQPSRAS